MTRQQLRALINYILQAGETPDARKFIHSLAGRVPQHEDELMTIAQQLQKIGRQEGLAEGEQLGERKARLDIARNLLEMGFDRASVMKMTTLTEEDLQEIQHQAN